MKTFLSLAVAIAAIVIAPSITMAAPVTFWFAGTVNYTENPGNTLPANIEIGTPFSGRITYDIALVTQTNLSTFAASKVANYYFRPVNGFTFLLQVGGHTVTNREITNLHWSGNIGVYDNHNNSDELFVDIGQNGLVTDGLEDTNSLVNFHVRDNSKTTFVNAGLPTAPPTLAAFPDARVLTWTQYDASDNTRFSFSGDITQISTNELVALNFRRPAPGTVRLSWPTAVAGGFLESSTNLASPTNWQAVANPVVPVGMENTVSLSTNGPGQFFRLKLH